jgi:hypothetical protein
MTPKLHPSISPLLLLCALGVLCGSILNAAEPYRASYYKDGEIHITILPSLKAKPSPPGIGI